MRELSLLVQKDAGIKVLQIPEESCNFKICKINNDVTVFLDGYIADASGLGDLKGEDVLRVIYALVVSGEQYDIASTINGHFNIIVVDREKCKIVVLTDRFALRPLYWSKLNRGIIVSTSIKRICGFDGFDAKINKQSLFQFIKYDFVLDGATFFKSINRLSYASINCFYLNGDVSSQQYANWKEPESINTNSVNANAEIIYSLLDRAVRRTLKNVSSPAVTISGGLDSRVIAGLISRIQGGKPPAFFHYPLSPSETRGATGVVDILGGKMATFPFQNRLSRILSVPVEYGDGCTAVNQFWLFELFKEKIEPAEVDCVFDGFFLDMLMLPPHSFMHYGKHISYQNMKKREGKTFLDKIYGLPSGYFDQYFFDSKCFNMDGNALETGSVFLDELKKMDDGQFCRNMYLKTRGDRYVYPMANLNQTFCDIRFPGLDYDLFDFCMTLPEWQIRCPEVYIQVFKAFFPELCHVEWARTSRPLCEGIHSHVNGLKNNGLKNAMKFYLLRLSRGKIDFHTPHTDASYLFRRNVTFRKAVLDLFSGDRCIKQGVIGKKGLRRLLNNILLGKNDFFILERLLAIELFFSTFVDK